MKYINQYLSKLTALEPIETGLIPSIGNSKKYKAFIFDIYGTLLISSSGDIDEADPSVENINNALEACNIKHREPLHSNEVAKSFIDMIHKEIISTHNKEKESGKNFPEVVIENIFETVLSKFIKDKKLSGDFSKEIIKKLVFIFELASNKVWPMPYMKEILSNIDKLGIKMGIISNAQFYTPLIVNHFLNKTYEETEEIVPFDSSLIQYSYKAKKGKPDTSIFNALLYNLLNSYDIKANEAVYIGNDMLKDIYTASTCGMDTVLFAGDQRSLRLREDDPRCKDLKPTHIITDLSQLEELL